LVFTNHSLEIPLSRYLWSRVPTTAYVRGCGDRLLTESPSELADELADRILSECIDLVRVVEWVKGEWRDDDDSNYRYGSEVDGPSVARLWIAGRLEGDEGMLLHFPDTAGSRGIRPLAERPIPRTADGFHQDAYWMLPSSYGRSPFGSDSPYLWTEVLLPSDVYSDLRGVAVDARPSALLPRHFRERLDVLLHEVGRTVAEWSTGLTTVLLEVIEDEAARLRRRAVAREGLEFLPTWRPQTPHLSEAKPVAAPQPAQAVALSTERLSAQSFNDFLATTRKWIEPLARAPRSFAVLPEEDLSALLAAALNATFPFAGQEVFSYRGRTDVFVRADRLDGGSPEKVFIVENHWWDGSALLHKKLDQLLSYCTVRDTEAVLISMLRDVVSMPDVSAALLEHPLAPSRVEDICGFPVFEVVSGPQRLHVALVVIDLRARV
jgi:hypothetical protein